MNFREFKKEVANAVASLLEDIQAKYKFYNNEKVIKEILKNGAKEAKKIARQTLKRATRNLGLN